ncbi:MAG: transposase [Reyranellaceae bacterium]
MTYKGWHSRYLPHFDSAETVQFVTFQLADSLPRAVVEALLNLPDSFAHVDQRLDTGLGSCWPREPAIAQIVEQALLHFDGERYRLLAWCIMPSHVHVVVEPIDGNTLAAVVQSWKSFTAKQADRHLSRSGSFRHQDYMTGTCAVRIISRRRLRMSRTIQRQRALPRRLRRGVGVPDAFDEGGH